VAVTFESSPPSVLAVVTDREWCDHLRSILDSWTALTILPRARDLVEQSRVVSPDVALWHLGAPSDADDASVVALRQFRTRSPRTVILAYCSVSMRVAPLLVAAGRAGIDDVLLRGYDDLSDSIRRRLAHDNLTDASRRVLARIGSRVGPAWGVFAHCVRRAATTVLTVEQLAQELGVHRKTLHNRLRAGGLPSAERVIGWSRLHLVAIVLETPGRSVAAVTAQVGFSSVATLRSMLSRYTGLKLRDIRQADGFARLHGAFQCASRAREPVLATVDIAASSSVGDRATRA
jgi:AraC-like DNA-binding protein